MLLTDAVNSIEGYLNPDVFNRQDIRETICEHLTAGRLVMVKEALNESFAERMYKCLDEAENWQAHEDYRNQFHYHHHNLYDEILCSGWRIEAVKGLHNSPQAGIFPEIIHYHITTALLSGKIFIAR